MKPFEIFAKSQSPLPMVISNIFIALVYYSQLCMMVIYEFVLIPLIYYKLYKAGKGRGTKWQKRLQSSVS